MKNSPSAPPRKENVEGHLSDSFTLEKLITENFGPAYDPSQKKQLRDKLLRLLTREITHVSNDVLVHTLIETLKIKVTLDWHHFLCKLLASLPGRWIKLTNNPGFNASTMLLLTDGTVMCQQEGGVNWKKLTPDEYGSYINGTWSDLAPMHWTRRYYASAVLNDGRVLISGGEYSNAGGWTDKTEIYDPVTDTWTEISPPPGWGGVGDAPCAVLPDGRFFMGHFFSTKSAIYDPVTDTWTAGPLKGSSSSEESWVLLPDDTVITVRSIAPSERTESRSCVQYMGGWRHSPCKHYRGSFIGNRGWCAAKRRARIFCRRYKSYSAIYPANDSH